MLFLLSQITVPELSYHVIVVIYSGFVVQKLICEEPKDGNQGIQMICCSILAEAFSLLIAVVCYRKARVSLQSDLGLRIENAHPLVKCGRRWLRSGAWRHVRRPPPAALISIHYIRHYAQRRLWLFAIFLMIQSYRGIMSYMKSFVAYDEAYMPSV